MMGLKFERIQLSESEKAKLRTERMKAIIFSFIFLIICLSLVAYVMYSAGPTDGMFKVFAGIFFLFFIGVFAFILYSNAKKFTDDLKKGEKLLVEGEVWRKIKSIQVSSSGKSANVRYSWLLNVGGKEIEVNKSIYRKIRNGSEVRIELAPECKVMFNFEILAAVQDFQSGTYDDLLFEDEIDLIRRKRRRSVIRKLLFAILWTVITEVLLIILLFFMLANFPNEAVIAPIVALLLFGALLFWLIVALVRSTRAWLLFTSDIRAGVKELSQIVIDEVIISNAQVLGSNAVVTSKRGDFIYLVAGTYKMQIERADFLQLPERIMVKAAKTKASGTVLGFEIKR